MKMPKLCTYLIMSTLFVNSSIIAQKASNKDPFMCYSWKNRLLLISETDGETFEAIVKELETAEGLADRDLVWMVFHNGQIASNDDLEGSVSVYTWAVDSLFRKGKKILLIGKDGDIKARFDSLSLDEVYQVIDGMPMRRREMRERGQLDR